MNIQKQLLYMTDNIALIQKSPFPRRVTRIEHLQPLRMQEIAVQTLLWSLGFVIQINLEHDTITVRAFIYYGNVTVQSLLVC